LKSHYLWFFLVAFLPIIVNIVFAGVAYPGIGRVLLFLAIALAVGFVEEAFFRGMMLHALSVRGLWQAAIISSIFFGVAHLLNVAAGANLASTILQIFYAFAIGLMYAALALRTQTILPLIVTHGLTDFFGFIALNSTVVTSGVSTLALLVTAGEIVIYLAYSVFLMRQVRTQKLRSEMHTQSFSEPSTPQ
jgi:membrane protease YdiL (CAAX protease family)